MNRFRHFLRIAMVFITAFSALSASAQCADDNTLYNVPATPPCPGSITVGCVWGGEYVLVNVVAGNTYTFSTCGAFWDTQITLYNNAGGGSLGFNDDGCGLQSTITWVATFTGQLRVLVDQYNCANNFICAGLTIGCTPGTPPAGDCIYMLNLFDSFGDGWGTSYVGVSINGGPYQNYTVAGSTNSVMIGVNIGDIITLNYNNSGAWQGENSYSLTLGGGALFNSGTPPAAGISYAGTVTCNPPPAPPEDCIGSITICNNQAFNNNTNNTGNIADLSLTTAGCLLNTERQGTWYNFTPSAGGQIAFTINPANPLDDYDFAIWGPFPPGSTPNAICPPLAAPLRCSYASPSGATGLNYAATDFSETAFGDKWVQYLSVSVGQVYLMYVSNWSQSGLAFSLTWDLQGGASLDCTQLGANLIGLGAQDVPDGVLMDWTSANVVAGTSFAVERAVSGGAFLEIGRIEATDSHSVPANYTYLDRSAPMGALHFRLRIADLEGITSVSDVVSVLRTSDRAHPVLVPNPTSAGSTVRFFSSAEGTVRIEVLDPRGRMVGELTTGVDQGFNHVDLPLDGQLAGAYLVRIALPDGTIQQARLTSL